MIDGACFRWTRSHGHHDGACADTFSAWLDGVRGGGLRVVFRDGEGGSTTTGQGWGGHDGGLLVGGLAYNLHRPALAACLIRAALADGWRPGERAVEYRDGFALLARAGAPHEPRR